MIKIDCEGCKWSGAASSTAAFTPSLAHYLTTIEQEKGGGEKGRERKRERHHYHVDDDVHCHPTDSAYQLHSGSQNLLALPRRMAAWMMEPSVWMKFLCCTAMFSTGCIPLHVTLGRNTACALTWSTRCTWPQIILQSLQVLLMKCLGGKDKAACRSAITAGQRCMSEGKPMNVSFYNPVSTN